MKTIKQTYFERYKTAKPKLDRIRRSVVDSIESTRSTNPIGHTARSVQHDLTRGTMALAQPRWLLLATAWSLILLLNATKPNSGRNHGPTTPVVEPAPQAAELLRAQRELLKDLPASDESTVNSSTSGTTKQQSKVPFPTAPITHCSSRPCSEGQGLPAKCAKNANGRQTKRWDMSGNRQLAYM